MQATLDIDDEVLKAAQDAAASREVSVDRLVSDLLRLALHPNVSYDNELGLPMFRDPPGTPPIDMQKLREAIAEAI